MKRLRILITGFSGFVSRHFINYLYDNNIEAEICGIDIVEPLFDYLCFQPTIQIDFQKINLLDELKLRCIIEKFVPEYVLHLASYSSVAYSWKYPAESFKNNTNIFLNLVMILKDVKRDCRILSIGSSEEYGNVCEKDLPLKEDAALHPNSPYSVARVSQEMLSEVFAKSYQMNIVFTRSFNHIGPYQDERFVVPSFIKRILNISKYHGDKIIETGDISIIRDFVDVRDVVKAYYLLLINGTSGQVYNICSGKGISLQSVINYISEYVGINVMTKINYDYVRPQDNKIMIGNADKIADELGWKSVIPIEKTLKDMIEEMKRNMK